MHGRPLADCLIALSWWEKKKKKKKIARVPSAEPCTFRLRVCSEKTSAETSNSRQHTRARRLCSWCDSQFPWQTKWLRCTDVCVNFNRCHGKISTAEPKTEARNLHGCHHDFARKTLGQADITTLDDTSVGALRVVTASRQNVWSKSGG